MSENKRFVEEKLLKILEEAIVDENASTERYQYALSLAKEKETRDLLEKLVKDEMEHEALLKDRYHEIKKRLGFKVMKEK